MDTKVAKELDVTKIMPREKHPAIFKTFDSLSPGESFILINDHDPKPLKHQFSFERKDAFNWEYVEQGPKMWRVKLTRTK
jgi:uncharacterized protein (DUF2249 family)